MSVPLPTIVVVVLNLNFSHDNLISVSWRDVSVRRAKARKEPIVCLCECKNSEEKPWSKLQKKKWKNQSVCQVPKESSHKKIKIKWVSVIVQWVGKLHQQTNQSESKEERERGKVLFFNQPRRQEDQKWWKRQPRAHCPRCWSWACAPPSACCRAGPMPSGTARCWSRTRGPAGTGLPVSLNDKSSLNCLNLTEGFLSVFVFENLGFAEST